jgi:hypothetical protein
MHTAVVVVVILNQLGRSSFMDSGHVCRVSQTSLNFFIKATNLVAIDAVSMHKRLLEADYLALSQAFLLVNSPGADRRVDRFIGPTNSFKGR